VKQKYLILLSLAGLIVCLDQLTKLLVRAQLPEGTSRPWIGCLWLTHHRNQGMALTIFEKLPQPLHNLFFIAVPIFALVLIVLIFVKLQDNEMSASVALTSILGGALGNMLDRFEIGPVMDIIQIRWGTRSSFPFNLADIAIVLGVLIVFIYTSYSHWAEKKTYGSQ